VKPREVFLNALHRRPTPRPATGSATSIATVDLMEETGCFFPDAHLDPKVMEGLAAAGHEILGFDNVMPLFSVCHESAAIGCKVDWGRRDLMPTITARRGIRDEVRIPVNWLSRREAQIPLDAIRALKRRFSADVAVVGKVFGPWTLGYHVFGAEEFLINTLLEPDLVKRAMETLKSVTVAYAKAQIDAGADAVCLGDHATRDLCSPAAYAEFLKDIHTEFAASIPCPLILHICGDTADRIGYIRETGLSCFHFDSKVPAATARSLAGDLLALMGGTSNFRIIREGAPETIAADVAEKLAARIDVLGPECAVPLDAPSRNMRLFVDEVRRQSHSSSS
jgi:[methyl-Co(III) methanol-specific corrinoid protein]:coenzyme M methyltransferase